MSAKVLAASLYACEPHSQSEYACMHGEKKACVLAFVYLCVYECVGLNMHACTCMHTYQDFCMPSLSPCPLSLRVPPPPRAVSLQGYAFAAAFNRITVMTANYCGEGRASGIGTLMMRANYRDGLVAGLNKAVVEEKAERKRKRCVCERERERERELISVHTWNYAYVHRHYTRAHARAHIRP